jgi:hypothetical protein
MSLTNEIALALREGGDDDAAANISSACSDATVEVGLEPVDALSFIESTVSYLDAVADALRDDIASAAEAEQEDRLEEARLGDPDQ